MNSRQAEIPAATDSSNARNAVLAGFLGWTLDAFDFFILTFILNGLARLLIVATSQRGGGLGHA